MKGMVDIKRCRWAESDSILRHYHDYEWGRPVFSEQKLFEDLSLEIIQAGLRWRMILQKREALDHAFANFDYHRVAEFNRDDLKRLLTNRSIIRNRQKLTAVIYNARAVLHLHQINLTLKELTWRPVHYTQLDRLGSPVSRSNCDLFTQRFWPAFKRHHFERVGPKTLYSYLQAVGVVNDHALDCDWHDKVGDDLLKS